MKPLPTYPGMLADIMLESREKICMQELKVDGKVSNSMLFMYYLNKNFLGVYFLPVTLLLV